jgi:RNA polymerase sigma factor (sigma-70 family)
MATGQLKRVIDTLRKATLPREETGLTDGQLLDNYVRSREEAAFAALVRRHGPMVWGVCRRLLGSHHDAEDAFQATFLVLVRKASSILQREKVANWLYGVAHQTALKARAMTARRRTREKQVTAMPEPEAVQQDLWNDLQPLLDQELSRLPGKYRTVIVVCDLDGRTRKEAARQLKLPEGTVASRLATARAMLAKRLTRPELALSAGALAAMLSEHAASAGLPISVVSATIKAAGLYAAGGTAAATGGISMKAIALAETVLKNLLLARLKASTVVLAFALLGAGATVLVHQALADKPRSALSLSAVVGGRDRGEEILESGVWPQWRGPNRDGVVHGVAVPEKWPQSLTPEWQVTVGNGVASPVVVGGKVYVFTRDKDDEAVHCLDLVSGKENWKSEPYPAPYKPGPGEGSGDNRPRSTPVVAAGKVFALGMTGILSCLDARDGRLLWRKDTKYCYYGGSSPLVTDNLCIAHVGDGAKTGGLTAFDIRSGDIRWCYAEGASATSGSPILVDLAGHRQIITYSDWNARGISVATGEKLWGVGPGGAGMPCTTPVQYKDLIILADNMDSLRALRLEKTEKGIVAKDVWKSKDLPLYYSSPVVAGDLVFGLSTRNQGCFFCLDARTGRTLWKTDGRQGGYASILSAGRVLLFLTDRGRLIVVKANAETFEAIVEYRVSDNATEAHPVFLGDRILIKDAATLRSFRISN